MHIIRSSAFPLSLDLLIKSETRNISSWLSGFWRVSFEWKITYMLMACLDSARFGSGCLCCLLCANGLSSFSPRAAVFCFKKRSVFTARFFHLPFWESYFSISPYILGWRMELSGRKTVKIINISIYNSLQPRLLLSCDVVVFILERRNRARLSFNFLLPIIIILLSSIESFVQLYIYIDTFWLLGLTTGLWPASISLQDGNEANSKQAPCAQDENVCNWNSNWKISISSSTFQFLHRSSAAD